MIKTTIAYTRVVSHTGVYNHCHTGVYRCVWLSLHRCIHLCTCMTMIIHTCMTDHTIVYTPVWQCLHGPWVRAARFVVFSGQLCTV